MPRMQGKHALIDMLRAHRVKYVFGNPGTTEAPLLDALQDAPDIQYIVGLQESVSTFMADGYARAIQWPAFINVHISPGLGNAISPLYNSFRGGTPYILTAGQTDTRLNLREPVLWSDMVDVVRSYTKWSAEVLHPEDIPLLVRRAFKTAIAPPSAPVFLSLPWDVLDREADYPEAELAPAKGDYYDSRPSPDSVQRAARALARARNPLMLIGDRIAQAGPRAVEQAVRVAELTGAAVYAISFSEVNFPTSHGQFQGAFNFIWPPPRLRRLLEQTDLALVVGASMVSQFTYTPQSIVPPGLPMVHLDCSPWTIERDYPVQEGLLGGIHAGLRDLADALEDTLTAEQREAARTRAAALASEKAQRRQQAQQRLKERWSNLPIAPERMMHELAQAMPPDTIVYDESVTNRPALFGAVDFDRPGTFFSSRGGGLGYGMPGALGVKLAHPDRPVVAVVGDGAAMYTIQALWTAAKYGIGVVYVMCNNRSYKVLKEGMARYLTDTGRQSIFLGMDFDDYPFDFQAIAKSYGIPGVKVEEPEALGPALKKALASGGPYVVDVVIDKAVPVRQLQEEYKQWRKAGA